MGGRYIIVAGTDRCWTVYGCSSDKAQALQIAKLEEAKKSASPTLHWIVVPVEDCIEWIHEVKQCPEAFRIKGGKIEIRPSAWCSVSPASPNIGDTITVSVDFDSEPNAEAEIRFKFIDADGQKTQGVVKAPWELDADVVCSLEVQPVSAPHYNLISTLEIA